MRQKTITLYKFEELSEAAQKKVIDKNYDINVDNEFWHESVIDDAKEQGKPLGFDIKKIYFSGFSSQGDGACFAGSFDGANIKAEELKKNCPEDRELHRIANQLAEIQKETANIGFSVVHCGHYNHKGCTEFSFEIPEELEEICAAKINQAEETLTELARDYMEWIYSQLETQYEYLTSEEQIKETLIANEYEFKEDGSPA